MKYDPKKTIIGLFTIGVTLLIISTYIYSSNIPNKYDRIDKLKYMIDVSHNMCDNYKLAVSNIQVLQNQWNILAELDAPDIQIENIKYYIRDLLLLAIINGKSCYENRDISQEEVTKYTALDFEEMEKEFLKLSNSMLSQGIKEMRPNEVSEIKTLEDKIGRNKVLGLILQISGLIINQLAAILQFKNNK